MPGQSDDIFEPSEERLAAIKLAGGQRRKRRRAGLATAGLLAVGVLVAVPLVSQVRDSSSTGSLAARQPDGRECRDSTRSACGSFRWDPVPSRNQPLRAELAAEVDGQGVTVAVRWEDPDAPRVETPLVCWDDPCGPPPEPCVQSLATGAWTPPRPLPGEGELRFRHTYRTPGPHRVTIALRSHAWPEQSCPPGPGDPYSDIVVLSTTVTTRGAA